MRRLLIHVEGETEEAFVNEVLSGFLCSRGYETVAARLVGNARLRDRRGGIRSWQTVKRDILNHLKEDRACFATTLVDYYGLPQSEDKGWPGRMAADGLPFADKARCVERALLADISADLGETSFPQRFVPFVVMHEFEGLLFSDCAAFGRGIARSDLAPSFQSIRDQFATPEEINDSSITAPSKRALQLVEGYEKPLHGTLAVLEIGLDAIRRECPHFNAWLETLERLAR